MHELRSVLMIAALATALLFSLPQPVFAGGGMNCGFGSFDSGTKTTRIFPTYGVVSPDGKRIEIPIRAWVHTHKSGTIRGIAIRKLGSALDIEPGTPEHEVFHRRMLDFMVSNEAGVTLYAKIEGRSEKEQRVGVSGEDGHVDGVLQFKYKPPKDASIQTIKLMIRADDDKFGSKVIEVPIVPAKGLTVISDIDDTFKVTNVVDKNEMVANTFTREFHAVGGMSKLFQKWADQGAAFHYVSASPWTLYTDLKKFAEAEGFPSGVYHLRVLRLKDLDSSVDFVRESAPHKISNIETLFARFPQRTFILVGDTGEKDPEVYADLARRFPDRVKHLYLRRVDGANNEASRFEKTFDGIPTSKWTVFSDPATL